VCEAGTKEDAMAMVTDPVCGMKIDDAEAAGTAEHEGRTFFFCSEACRDAFVADPASYAGAGT
jgi:Cu+-exporting ATPase